MAESQQSFGGFLFPGSGESFHAEEVWTQPGSRGAPSTCHTPALRTPSRALPSLSGPHHCLGLYSRVFGIFESVQCHFRYARYPSVLKAMGCTARRVEGPGPASPKPQQVLLADAGFSKFQGAVSQYASLVNKRSSWLDKTYIKPAFCTNTWLFACRAGVEVISASGSNQNSLSLVGCLHCSPLV